MRDDASRTSGTHLTASSPSEVAPIDVCADAIAELVRLILQLRSTNAAINYANGACVREELEHGLREAQQTFEALPEERARVKMLRRLDGLRAIADRELAIAPTPSAAAKGAADAGDPTLWFAEADEWAAERLGHGASQLRAPWRPLSDTCRESPGMLRAEPLDRATTQGALASVAPTGSPPDKVGRR